jgi:SpoVK/Ycf46/Vps4 family AAA+-type ATPase
MVVVATERAKSGVHRPAGSRSVQPRTPGGLQVSEHGHEHGIGPAGTHASGDLPAGIARIRKLPGDGAVSWDHLFLPSGLKERLRNFAVVALLHRDKLSPVRGAPQGLVLLTGPPGTGKTTAARGLANAAAEALAEHGVTTLVEVDPHALPSDLLGQSQRNVSKLLARTLPEVAAGSRFTVVLADEVEALATSRAAASFDTNPADLHRATDAVLWGLDHLASSHPSLMVVATTNFPAAVDAAFLNRADLVVPFAPPDAEQVARIVGDCLDELAAVWPELASLAATPGLADRLAVRCAGLDGRRIRKLTTAALTIRQEVAQDPRLLTEQDLEAAAETLSYPEEA